jgi:heparan-alpha-glucosaminide N-acetyltransferase
MSELYDLAPEPEPKPETDTKPLGESEFGLSPAAPGAPEPTRLISLDAYRGFVMLAMASSGLGIPQVAREFPESTVWKILKSQSDHIEWAGCSFWDMIQPSFMFIVGVAMPWAYANRKAKGEGWWSQFGHAIARALVLIALGVFLSSNGNGQTNWTFVNVLTQIGLGYPFVFLILGWKPAWQFVAAFAVLIGYWVYFAFWPLPGTEGSWPVALDWGTIQAHWAKNANAASQFDVWFLNLLPYPNGKPFVENGGGYATLNFIPSIATAIFGVLVGRLLKSNAEPKRKLTTLAVAGVAGIVAGMVMGATICPDVKRIWTPSWVLESTGWACLMMAIFYLVIDVVGWRKLAFPFVVVGANSIVMYVMSQLITGWIKGTLRTHLTTLTYVLEHWFGLGPSVVPKIEHEGSIFTGTYAPIYDSAAILFVLWLICLWLYRRKIFVRI